MKQLLPFLFIPLFSLAQSQTWVIKGKVMESALAPISFASVYVNNTSLVTTADENGFFNLKIPAGFRKVEVVASFVGYKSTKKIIERANAERLFYTFELTSATILSEVKVKAKMDRDWKKRWRIFESGLKGESPFTKDCLILNPEAVILSYDSLQKQVVATASEPVVLQNRALGLKIFFHMETFQSNGEKTFFAGHKFFQEIPAEDEKVSARYIRNRDLAYRNSFRNFLVSLTQNRLKENGFRVYTVRRISGTYLTRLLLSKEITDGNFKEISAQEIGRWNPDTEQYTLHADLTLFIFALNRYDAGSVFADHPYKYSRLFLPNHSLSFNENGWITAPNGMILYDFWGQEGFSNLLPNDYLPAVAPSLDSLTLMKSFALNSQVKIPVISSKQVTVPVQGMQYERGKTLKIEEEKTLIDLDYEVSIEEKDNSLTVFDLLRRIPGLKVTVGANGYSISFRGNNTGSANPTPAHEIDGYFSDDSEWVIETINSLSVRQIKKIGAVKYGNSAAYGARGGKGVIVIQTVK